MEEDLKNIFDALARVRELSESREYCRIQYLSLGIKIIDIIERCKSLKSLQKLENYLIANVEAFNVLHIEDTHWSTGTILYMDETIRGILAKQLEIYSSGYSTPRPMHG